jgi:DNA-binding MarR family transcriptional regulator
MDGLKTGGGAEPFDGLAGYHLRRASVLAMSDLSAALAGLGLKPAEASALFMIAAQDGLTQAELGRALGIQRANMAPMMAGLIAKGWVSRAAVDGRSQALLLSRAGKDIHDQAMTATRAHEQRVFGTLSNAEQATLIGLLRRVWQG